MRLPEMSIYDEIKIGLAHPDLHRTIRIALANIPVQDKHIDSSCKEKPVLTRSRMKLLATLLNNISKDRFQKNKIDLVIFPEVSIPHDWEPMIVAWARRHNIGVICGLEHRINSKKVALNEMLAALPYKNGKNYTACLPIRRLKRIYSPHEIEGLKNSGLKIPKQNRNARDPYQLIRWRGASFAVYNCYELTNIDDRSIFKGKVDFIVAIECNQDVNYFSTIVEAASRDLHCYVIQVNNPEMVDSRIVSPSKTEKMNPLRIKGGENTTFLTMDLDLKALRDHQVTEHRQPGKSKSFKSIPPGLDLDDLKTRINLGITSVEELI